MEALNTLAWPMGRLGEAIMVLARLRGWQLRALEAPVYQEGLRQEGTEALGVWLEAAATWLGVEAEPVEVPYAEVESLVRRAGPALLRLPGLEKPGFLALLGYQGRRALLIGPDLAVEVGSTEESYGPGEPPELDRYTVLHVKRDGKWRMALARDEEGPPPTAHERLRPLADVPRN